MLVAERLHVRDRVRARARVTDRVGQGANLSFTRTPALTPNLHGAIVILLGYELRLVRVRVRVRVIGLTISLRLTISLTVT